MSTPDHPSAAKQPTLRLWRPAGLPGVVAVHGRDRSHRSAPCGELLVANLIRGRMEIVRDGRRHRMRPGELALWTPGEQPGGSFVAGDAWEARLLVIELPTFADLVDTDLVDTDWGVPGRGLRTTVLADPRLAKTFVKLHRMLGCPARAAAHESALAGWLDELAGRLPTGSRPGSAARRASSGERTLRTACELLRDDPDADLNLGKLAAACGISRFLLVRLFNAGLGLSPQRYHIQLRVQRARTMLEAGRTPSEVPHLAGFYDQSHLNRHFTRRLGITPARYAMAFRRAGSVLEPVHAGFPADAGLPAGRLPRPIAQVGRPLLGGEVPAEHVA